MQFTAPRRLPEMNFFFWCEHPATHYSYVHPWNAVKGMRTRQCILKQLLQDAYTKLRLNLDRAEKYGYLHRTRTIGTIPRFAAIPVERRQGTARDHLTNRTRLEVYQLKQRTISFDVLALQEAAVRSVSARSCVQMSKLGEGNFNKTLSSKWIMAQRSSLEFPIQMLVHLT
jgi:hypothetical protein